MYQAFDSSMHRTCCSLSRWTRCADADSRPRGSDDRLSFAIVAKSVRNKKRERDFVFDFSFNTFFISLSLRLQQVQTISLYFRTHRVYNFSIISCLIFQSFHVFISNNHRNLSIESNFFSARVWASVARCRRRSRQHSRFRSQCTRAHCARRCSRRNATPINDVNSSAARSRRRVHSTTMTTTTTTTKMARVEFRRRFVAGAFKKNLYFSVVRV